MPKIYNHIFKSMTPKPKKPKKTKKKKTKAKRSQPRERRDWVHADVTMLSPTELKEGLKSLRQSVARNVSTLEYHSENGMTSPAIRFLNENGGDIRSGGSIEDMRDEFAKAQSFMKMPEHTLKGYKEWVTRELATVTKTFHFDDLSEEEQKDRLNFFWYAFNRMKQAYPWYFVQPHRATDLIDEMKESILENPDIQSIEDAYLELEKYMEKFEENLPSALKTRTTSYEMPNFYGRSGSYSASISELDTMTVTRGDMRTKEFRSHKYSDKK